MISRACGNPVLASFHLIFLDLQCCQNIYIRVVHKRVNEGHLPFLRSFHKLNSLDPTSQDLRYISHSSLLLELKNTH